MYYICLNVLKFYDYFWYWKGFEINSHFMIKQVIYTYISDSDPLLRVKALLFNGGLNGDESFKTSSGWLRNFQLRHVIRETEVQGEKLSASNENAEKFISEFKNLIESESYDETFIYNADESELN